MDELTELDAGLIYIGKKDEELMKIPLYKKYLDDEHIFNEINDPVEKSQYFKLDRVKKLMEEYEMESETHLQNRIKHVIQYIKNCDSKKILIVSHGGFILELNKYILNADMLPKGDYKYGSNCHITYYQYKNDKFKLITYANTLHFKLYETK